MKKIIIVLLLVPGFSISCEKDEEVPATAVAVPQLTF